ncbi:circularly permuted type 2 ATP-grasp protein [Nocardioides sp. zg-536]|uniref:Circularly permuted type 2 ATP-grasp protein n=1 Tax=Nocardioides faecalis TaxID=2803858 RepID=A0A938Y5G2_9ACTN|nr:circularly permuted type 2 ATP-grasp protein [Nocardioides faecalis]MBM9458603.1 circularly permuted type 2 ATP-grasp protein [Nocardioides faecalis]QVI58603.1 circularly permuted type 2 ATP-grasp protein [Nocardioides faecalis]
MTLLHDYAASVGQPTLSAETGAGQRHDEMVGPDGSLRAPWKRLVEVATRIGPEDMRRITAEIERFLEDDGVTYSRPGQRPSAWQLDPIPLVLDAADAQQLEVGLAQRAELLNAVLADLYGEQSLLASGVVPAAVVLGHRGFTRVMARGSANDPRPLVLSATDVGRGPDGAWRVLGDRTQAPSGLGYALENRRVLSRVVPELYREADAHRMAPYLWALRSALLQSADGDLSDPRVVVLSPGLHSETYYDQATIAAQLGFPLVQGGDLTVRDGRVLMKTQQRLERVDVILRRVDTAFCDPLEMRGDSRLGVPGLAEAVRRGTVRVVNGLGAGVLENPGLAPYLPAACEHLLGESLRLPSVATWWCGDPEGLDHVLGHLDELVVRTIDGSDPTVVGASAERVRMLVLARPHAYVGHEPLELSQAPVWQGRDARPAPVTLRAFTLRYGSAYRPLLGGLGSIRDGSSAGGSVGGSVGSKDVWVLKAEPGQPDQGLAEVLPMTSARTLPATVPRVLEDMFWFGRYAERAEDLLRLVLAAHVLVTDYRAGPGSHGGTSLGVVMSAVHRLAGRVYEDEGDDLRSVLLDAERPGSAAQSLERVRDTLSAVRDQVSGDAWRALGVVERATVALESSLHPRQVAESAGRMLTGVLALHGVTDSMIRDSGWHMIGLGRSLERALQVCHLLRLSGERRGIDVDREVLGVVLSAAESSVTHRRRYRDYVRPTGVFDLLLVDPENPRSLLFNLHRAAEHLAAQPASTGSTRPERLLADLVAEVTSTDAAGLAAIGGVERPRLVAFLDDVTAQVERVAEAVADLHLASGPAPRAFGVLPTLEAAP